MSLPRRRLTTRPPASRGTDEGRPTVKDGLRHIVGRTISAVVVARNKRPPREQVFLLFDDGSRFEFYGDNFTCCGGVDDAAGLERYVHSAQGEIAHIYSSGADKLKAWAIAHAAIGRARK